MTRAPWLRMTGAVLGPIAPYGDVGSVEILVTEEHPYLRCDPCGVPLRVGLTMEDAMVYDCYACQRIVDTRRVG